MESKTNLENELLYTDISQNMGPTTFGEKLSDYMAKKGGSWGFIIGFLICLILWVSWNGHYKNALDPFPFIFLNLLLSCIAAIQAPIIMMNQNRSAKHDRLRAEMDYKINIKSEIEIRILNEKIDQLMTHQWQQLIDIQEFQLELLHKQVGLKK